MADEQKDQNEELVSQEQAIKAESIKEKANDYFRGQHYEQAIELYSEAINMNPGVPTYFGNRSICYLRTECFGYAVNDADAALNLDKTYIKGYYRRALANMALQKFKSSLKDLETVVKYRPKDKDAKLKYDECKKTVQRLAFERAIAVDSADSKPLSETINVEKMVIEEEYDGPRIEDEGVTEEFALAVMERFKQQKTIHNKCAYQILIEVKKQLQALPNLVKVTVPEGSHFTVCGDVHGQFYDLMNIFDLNGLPSKENPYLFNGDFVDRGSFSCEVIFTLFSFKLLYPNHFFMSRGNHESTAMNQMYGFEGEVKSKYTPQMADLFTEVYNWLPLSHLINKKVLVMHGGLFSEDNVSIDQINKVDRNRQPPEKGIMCDLLWSDPQPQCGRSPSKRGVGCQFGPDITKGFCEKNNLEYIIRSHEVKADGYEMAHDGRCITVFSAPNYCDQMGNKGAFITMNSDLKPKFTSYEAVPHPNVKPMAYANSLMSLFSGFM